MNYHNLVNSGSHAALSNFQATLHIRPFKPACTPTHYPSRGTSTLYKWVGE